MIPLIKETISDCNYHGFVAKISLVGRIVLVTESIDEEISVGSIVKNINGVPTNDLSTKELSEMFSSRNGKVIPTISSRLEYDTALDAKEYAKQYDELTIFVTCAICGEEGSSVDTVEISKCTELIKESNLSTYFERLTHCLHSTEPQISPDVQFARELEYYLPGGLLRGENHICKHCYKCLKKPKQSARTDTASSSEYCDDQNIPIDALINGLFQGHIQDEISSLNSIEQTMICLYSSISKIALHGGKSYLIKGATSYTIINDLTHIARSLPRLPSVDSIAILRQAKVSGNIDYKYRPYFVKKALIWLQFNNHLYKDVEYDWPEQHNWDDTNAVGEMPYLPPTEEDINAINENEKEINNGISDSKGTFCFNTECII